MLSVVSVYKYILLFYFQFFIYTLNFNISSHDKRLKVEGRHKQERHTNGLKFITEEKRYL